MPQRWRLNRDAEPVRGWRTALVLLGIFAGLASIINVLGTDRFGNNSFWPANAALVVAVLILPPRLALATNLACFAANLLLNSMTDFPVSDSLICSALNVAVSYLAGFLTRSLCGAATDLTRIRRLATFTVICFASSAIEALVGSLLDTPPLDPGMNLASSWSQWTLCDGLGLLLGTPAVLFAVKGRQYGFVSDAGRLERWVLLAGIVVLSIVAFGWAHTPLFLLLYPLLILEAFRSGPAWVLASVLLICIIASAMTAHGLGPLVVLSAHGNSMREDMIQPYLASLFLATIPANNALGEQNRITRRLRRLKASMEHEATHDALTALPNRLFFRRRLAAGLQASRVEAIVLIDLDRFKEVNDTLGHQAGDELLRAFSARLAAAAAGQALVARFGGDEFALLVTRDRAAPPIADLCRTMVAIARTPFILDQGIAHVSASVGVALTTPSCPGDAGELLRKADIALYAAKSGGRDGFLVFTDDLDGPVRERAEIEADLRVALESATGLCLNYQVKLDRTGAIAGVEALIRWNHPRLGFLPPSRFIPVAEDTGLIIPLGAWVLQEALAFAARWPQLHVAINVSPIQLRQAEFVDQVLAAIMRARVDPRRIELEVTETVFLNEVCQATESLQRLRASGLQIALDDFGTGYSSMRQLQRFKVDRLKIDRSFVAGLGESAEAEAIVQAMISLAHAMALQVTAEGVETEAQHAHLLAIGVDEFQGYHHGRPCDEAMLAKRMSRATALAAA